MGLTIVGFTIRMRMPTTTMGMSSMLASSWLTMQSFNHDQIAEEAYTSRNEHDLPVDLHWVKNSHGGLVYHPNYQAPDDYDGCEGSDDFGSMPPVGELGGGFAFADPDGSDGDGKAGHVGEEVRSVS